MSLIDRIVRSATGRIGMIALLIVGFDQLTKQLVLRTLGYTDERAILPGFFKLVHWGNSGAAFSLFRGNNEILAAVALIALVALYYSRHHFNAKSAMGQLALGLIFGGIIGNLIDRLLVGHVIDFLYFYVQQRGGKEVGFPAFNIADSAICTGVACIFLITWRTDGESREVSPPTPDSKAMSNSPP